ncbi:uncharacterized protein LOC141631074 [Silene latifolia]|uniref:uncharacterized protein LOC141631074 n=1 Tax=Silene latifolia TaxID=37657 RepID=UPI003D78268A
MVRFPSEKLSNTPPVLQDMLDFNDCLASCHLDDLTCTEVDMSWTNKQDFVTRVWSKLDRVLANHGFITTYPNAFGHFQEPGISDHSPILVKISQDKKGSPMYCFFQKLKNVKHALTHFHKLHFSNISHRVQSAKNALMEGQKLKMSRTLIAARSIFLQKFLKEPISRIFWGIVLLRNLRYDFISQGAVVTPSDRQSLIREISPTEIRDALFSMDSNSSPGIDGFSAGFFKLAWQIIAKDFCKAVNQFFSSSKMSKQANSTVISLIPKKAIPTTVTDYRPISCCTVFYKTVSKVLANRL